MLEVLIAMLIVSFSLISLLSLQITNLHHTYSAYWQTIASVQAHSFLEVLRANTSQSVRQNEYQLWNQQNTHLLPNGIGFYQCQNAVCTVKINWQEQATQSFSLTSTLWK